MKKEKRFEVVLQEANGLNGYISIWKDKQTGVEYLFVGSGYGGGLTPLLDRYGKPIVTTIGASEIEN